MAVLWYAVQTRSGYEHKVKANIENQVEMLDLGDQVLQILIPQEERLEVVKDKRRPVKRKIYPGYIFIEMDLNDATLGIIKNTEGVTKFLGPQMTPEPISDEEMDLILKRVGLGAKAIVDFRIGDTVTVLSGPFADFTGQINEIDFERQKLRVLLSIFGRETPIELDFNQVAKSDED
jgi:transcriptional antiterminator NusG